MSGAEATGSGVLARVSARAGAGLEAALRRVVVGYRAAAVVWLGLLGAVVTAGGQLRVAVWLGTVAVAAVWAGLTLALRWRDHVLGSAPWLVADVAVSAGIILGPTLTEGADVAFFGGYPFSSVILAAWQRGLVGALASAIALATVSVWRLGPALAEPITAQTQVVDTYVFYVAGSAVLAWGLGVLRRNDAERRAAEEALAAERADRALAEERAETAAHLHDSVLQTLALVQRRSGDPVEVAALARQQERELRDWLGGVRGGGALPGPASFAETIKAAAAEIERVHRLSVDAVTVGDAPADADAQAVVAAAREALVNAAKHAGTDRVWLYAEAGPSGVEVFVRDRGSGFDPGAVAGDRRGIRESICGRLERHGGSAAVRSAPGKGTEVVLHLPRDPAAERAVP